MDEMKIRQYASLMRELDLTGIEINEKKGVIRLERGIGSVSPDTVSIGSAGAGSLSMGGAGGLSTENAGAGALSMENPAAETLSTARQGADAKAVQTSDTESILSPMVGVFYAAPAENADPFVKPGDRVKKGEVLCIIEAMKLMNEILAEKDGVIEEVCARDGQVVEFGTELFKIKE